MACPNSEKNLAVCTCSYPSCSRKGNCCECVSYHLSKNELPACAFPAEVEKTYDRSFRRFAQIYK